MIAKGEPRSGRSTRQLEATRAALAETDRHPTVEEVHDRVRLRLGRASLATTYRNLRKLVSEGRAIEIAVPGRPARFDGRLDPHDHFLCRACSALIDVGRAGASRSVVLDEDRDAGAHVVDDWSVLFRGVCAACTSRSRVGD
ncbi:transcriptional repressor [bacterium]|nr:transcriptional repressor [bacterium]